MKWSADRDAADDKGKFSSQFSFDVITNSLRKDIGAHFKHLISTSSLLVGYIGQRFVSNILYILFLRISLFIRRFTVSVTFVSLSFCIDVLCRG